MKNQLHTLRVITIVFALALLSFSAQVFAGSLSGKITKTSDGSPVAGATVSAQSPSYSYSTTTDAGGNYYMWVNSGTYTLKVSKDLYRTKTVTGVAEGEVKNLTLDFNHFGFIGGSYYNAYYWDQYIFAADFGVGNPKLQAGDEIGIFCHDTIVGLLILEGPITAYYQPKLVAFGTLSDGQTQTKGYTPGHESTYKCYTSNGVEALGTATRSNPWGGTPYMGNTFPTANPYSITNLSFTGPAARSVVVTVSNSGLSPVPNVKVLVNNILDTTDVLGQVTFTLLGATYAITATPITPGLYDPYSGSILVPAGPGSSNFSITLASATTTIKGKVTKSADASPVVGATISALATSGGGTVSDAFTDVDGNYTLTCPNVAGTYTVRAVAAGLTTATKTNVTVTKGNVTSGQNFSLTAGSPFADVTGDPNEVWTIYLKKIAFGNYDINIGDEVAVYDNVSNKICGKFVLTSGFSGNPYQNEMVVFLNPTSPLGIGDVHGHQYSFKAWSAHDNKLMEIVSSQTYSSTSSYDPSFPYTFPMGNDLYSIADVNFFYAAAATTQTISLHAGSNFVSSYVTNKELSGSTATGTAAMDIDNLMYLGDAGVGIANGTYTSVVKDRTGIVFTPFAWTGHGVGLSEGPGKIIWDNQQAYCFKTMTGPHTLVFTGDPVNPATPITIHNTTGSAANIFIPYLQSYAMDASYALRSITSNPPAAPLGNTSVSWIKDDLGHMIRFLGGEWVNNIGNCNPGMGYQVQIPDDDQITLVYSGLKSMELSTKEDDMPTHFRINGDAANWIYSIYLDVTGFNPGDEIAAFDGNQLVGATKLVASGGTYKNAIPVFHQLTDRIGYQPGNPIILKGYDAQQNKEVKVYYTLMPIKGANPWLAPVYPAGDGKYSLAAISRYGVGFDDPVSASVNVYPNPAHDMLKVVGNQRIDKVALLSVLGQTVLTKNIDGQEAQMNVSGFVSGIYILQITMNGQIITKKVFIN
jgi:hypothetical protein